MGFAYRKRHPGRSDSAQDSGPSEKNLAALADGQSATVVGVQGGGHLQVRLANMGIRTGKTITKRGALPGQGPVTVEVDGCRVALGRGIARKVLVDLLDPPARENA